MTLHGCWSTWYRTPALSHVCISTPSSLPPKRTFRERDDNCTRTCASPPSVPCSPSPSQAHLVGHYLELALAGGGVRGQQRVDEREELLHHRVLPHVVVAALHQLPEDAALAVADLR